MDVRWMERAQLLGSARDVRGRTEIAAIGARELITPAQASAWARAVLAAKDDWTSDFDGEQFTLGRAFYTHYETDQSDAYFEGAGESDETVERHLPGMQQRMRDVVALLTGGVARARREWCGAGVHVFPANGEVAHEGGVVHFDIEGLSEKHARDKRAALTIVVMLQEPESGGGLKLWDVRFRGRDTPNDAELAATSVVAQYGVGGALVIDSYRMHQIQPFAGDRDRVSITIHAAEIDEGIWETWF
ncbi:MAG TPA: hypothetical protein VH054_00125 [Polyangiaceae bacterium]|jgi:hypothetical protein|nr:hypothetical protein [Polyangiaceae bacterium]